MNDISSDRKQQATAKRVRKTRSDKGERRLTERDVAVLKRIGEQGAIRYDLLQHELAEHSDASEVRKHGSLSLTSMYEVIKKWEALGLIERMKPFTYQQGFLYLTAKGISIAGLDFPAFQPAESTLHHLHWCFVVRRYLERERPTYKWWSERYLRQEHAEAARARGENRTHKLPDLPDAHLETPRGIYAIEVELSPKQQWKLEALIQKRAIAYNTVWYFCNAETRSKVEAATTKLHERYRQRISVYDLSQIEPPASQDPGKASA